MPTENEITRFILEQLSEDNIIVSLNNIHSHVMYIKLNDNILIRINSHTIYICTTLMRKINDKFNIFLYPRDISLFKGINEILDKNKEIRFITD